MTDTTVVRETGQRSTKRVACTALATGYQREFVKTLQKRVVEDGEPFAIVQADTPHEIFHAAINLQRGRGFVLRKTAFHGHHMNHVTAPPA